MLHPEQNIEACSEFSRVQLERRGGKHVAQREEHALLEVSHAACAARLSGPGHEDGPQLAHCPGEAGPDLEIQGQAST